MKKIIFIVLVFIFFKSFSQGKLCLYNYSDYDIEGRIFARGIAGCYPSIWTSYKFPATTQSIIYNYNSSLPYTDKWDLRLSPTGTIINQYPPSSGLLSTLSDITRWQYTWFLTKDLNGNQTGDQFSMGDNAFSTACGSFFVTDYQQGNLSEAYWFYLPSTNETYLIIK